MSEYVLELKGITKIFPGVKALNNVQFQLKPGEVHALMGENGAGKSTFIKVITGVHKAEEGEMYLFGEKVDFKGPKHLPDSDGLPVDGRNYTGAGKLFVVYDQ